MLEVGRYAAEMYSQRYTTNALYMSLGALGRSPIPASAAPRMLGPLPPTPLRRTEPRPVVKAATLLSLDSSTGVINAATLMAKPSPTPLVQYVEIADSEGKLYCVNREIALFCWIKMVNIASDCQSSNVLLATNEEGVFLKTIRAIIPGEPLSMWFTENILAMLNMPYLTDKNISTRHDRYVCHVCHLHFEFPNTLKIHLALDCNRQEYNHMWTQLGHGFQRASMRMLSMDRFQKPPPAFDFTLTGSPKQSPSPARVTPTRVSPTRVSPTRVSPTRVSPPAPVSTPSRTPTPARVSPSSPEGSFNISPQALLNVSAGAFNLSFSTSTSSSPNSSAHTSPKSPGELSYCSSASSTTPLSPVKRNIGQRHSAFKPYTIHKPTAPAPSTVTPPILKPIMPAYQLLSVATPPPSLALVPVGPGPIEPDAHAAHMETVASNLGKSKAGHHCIYCGKIYSRKYGLKIHIRTHTGYKPLKCKFCSRPFGDPSNLNKHVRLHADGETPYRCDLCGKVLVRRRDLERHIKSRHQDNAEDTENAGSPEARDTDGTTDEDMDDIVEP